MGSEGKGHSALLVIDMQRWLRGIAETILPQVNDTISDLRRARVPIIFTQQGVKKDAIIAPNKSKPSYQKALPCPTVGELGWELMSGLDHTDQDLYITARPSYDAFHETDLHYILKELEIDTLIICGVMTNTACETTARTAFTHNYNVFFCSDGTATNDNTMHDHSLKTMRFAGIADIVTCRVARGRFQKPWIQGHLARRQLTASYEFPPGVAPSPGIPGNHGLVGRCKSARRAGNPPPRVPVPAEDEGHSDEDEGWWLRERRAEKVREAAAKEQEEGGGNENGGATASIFERIRVASGRTGDASASRRNPVGSRAARAAVVRGEPAPMIPEQQAVNKYKKKPVVVVEEPVVVDEWSHKFGIRLPEKVPRAPTPTKTKGTGAAKFFFSANVSEAERRGMQPPSPKPSAPASPQQEEEPSGTEVSQQDGQQQHVDDTAKSGESIAVVSVYAEAPPELLRQLSRAATPDVVDHEPSASAESPAPHGPVDGPGDPMQPPTVVAPPAEVTSSLDGVFQLNPLSPPSAKHARRQDSLPRRAGAPSPATTAGVSVEEGDDAAASDGPQPDEETGGDDEPEVPISSSAKPRRPLKPPSPAALAPAPTPPSPPSSRGSGNEQPLPPPYPPPPLRNTRPQKGPLDTPEDPPPAPPAPPPPPQPQRPAIAPGHQVVSIVSRCSDEFETLTPPPPGVLPPPPLPGDPVVAATAEAKKKRPMAPRKH